MITIITALDNIPLHHPPAQPPFPISSSSLSTAAKKATAPGHAPASSFSPQPFVSSHLLSRSALFSFLTSPPSSLAHIPPLHHLLRLETSPSSPMPSSLCLHKALSPQGTDCLQLSVHASLFTLLLCIFPTAFPCSVYLHSWSICTGRQQLSSKLKKSLNVLGLGSNSSLNLYFLFF